MRESCCYQCRKLSILSAPEQYNLLLFFTMFDILYFYRPGKSDKQRKRVLLQEEQIFEHYLLLLLRLCPSLIQPSLNRQIILTWSNNTFIFLNDPTNRFTISGPQNPPINDFYGAEKHRSMIFVKKIVRVRTE